MAVYPEERVNSYTPDYQYQPGVSPLAGGGYVVVWTSRGQDGSGDGIYAQRYDGSGIPAGPEFRVNTHVSGYQVEAQVAGLSDGSFVVLWTDQSGLDGSSDGVFMQRYSALGSPLGGEQRVNISTSNQQDLPSVAVYDGGFVAAWASYYQDGSGWGIYAQRYDNTGTTVGTEFRVNTTTSGEQYEPQVARAPMAASSSCGATTASTAAATASTRSATTPMARQPAANSASTPPLRMASTSPRWRCLTAATSSWCGARTIRTAARRGVWTALCFRWLAARRRVPITDCP